MATKQLALLIGGILPALLLGFAAIIQRYNTNAGTTTGPFLIGVGLTAVVVGALFTYTEPDTTITAPGVALTFVYGLFWAVATGCIAFSLQRYGAQLSQIVPLYNMNTLVAVLLSLMIFAEWRTVNVFRIVVAAVFIILGGVLASRA